MYLDAASIHSISSSSLLEDDPSEDEDSLCRVFAFASIADRVSWASSLLSALFFGSEKLAILSNNLFLAIEGGTTDGRFVIPHANVECHSAYINQPHDDDAIIKNEGKKYNKKSNKDEE